MPRPSPTCLAGRLRQLSLNSPPASALFYARLFADLCPNDNDHEAIHILALCLLETKQTYSALHVVRERADAGCKGCAMLVARCCQELGRYTEGQAVLERALRRGTGSTSLPVLSPSTNAYLTLADLSRKAKANEAALENYQRALAEDPWSWEAFTGLCAIGVPPEVDQLFPDPPVLSRAPSVRHSRPPTLSPNPMPRSSASEMPFLPTRKQLSPRINGGAGNAGFFTPDTGAGPSGRMGIGMGGLNTWDSPSALADNTFAEHSIRPQTRRPLPSLISSLLPGGTSSMFSGSGWPTATSTPVNDNASLAVAPGVKRIRNGHGVRRGAADPPPSALPTRNAGRDLKSIEPNGEGDAPVRRSTRLKSGPTVLPSKASKTRERQARRSRSATSSAASVEMTSPPSHEGQMQAQADDWLRDIVRRCAKAYRALCVYSCQEAIREIDTLPAEIQLSAWANDIVARAYYEMAKYLPALARFEHSLELEPYRLETMEIYSTLLWHLTDSDRLSHLAQTLMSVSREAPQSWIAAGNLFSLQKDHDEAMRCFKRATQIDPGCSYAWTLCGYEAIEMEEYERAIAFYRTAIRTDPRHYNAWYGMGLVYLKTGKLQYAEHHFRRARTINPTNAVLLACMGSVLEQQGEVEEAYKCYDEACTYEPDSPLIRFKAIRALVSMNQIDDAINQLQALTRTRDASDEANVFFLLGKCLLKRERRGEATVAFTTARELQPKLENAIKAAIEHDGDDTEDDEYDDE